MLKDTSQINFFFYLSNLTPKWRLPKWIFRNSKKKFFGIMLTSPPLPRYLKERKIDSLVENTFVYLESGDVQQVVLLSCLEHYKLYCLHVLLLLKSYVQMYLVFFYRLFENLVNSTEIMVAMKTDCSNQIHIIMFCNIVIWHDILKSIIYQIPTSLNFHLLSYVILLKKHMESIQRNLCLLIINFPIESILIHIQLHL